MEAPRRPSIVPSALIVGALIVVGSLLLRWLDIRGDDSPAKQSRRSSSSRNTTPLQRTMDRPDTGTPIERKLSKLNPIVQARTDTERTERVMQDLAASGRPVVRCLLGEPLPGGKARRPQVLEVTGQPADAHLLAFATADAIFMSLPERAAGSALLAPEGFLPIEIQWTAPREGELAECSPSPLFFRAGGTGITGLVFRQDAPQSGALVVATCGDELYEVQSDVAGEFFIPAPEGRCSVDAELTNSDSEWISPPIDVDVPSDGEAVIELELLPIAERGLKSDLRQTNSGFEVTTVSDPLLAVLGVKPGDQILQIGEVDTRDISAAEAEELLQAAWETGGSVAWRTSDGGLQVQSWPPTDP